MESRSKSEEKPKKNVGRPTKYTQAIADSICNSIATNVLGLKAQAKRHPEWPDQNTIYEWIASNREGFGEKYARAKVQQLQSMEDEMLGIADDGSNDWMETKKGKMLDREAVQRSQLRIDTRKWLMSHLLPKKYSDKLTLDGSLSIGLAEAISKARERVGAKIEEIANTEAPQLPQDAPVRGRKG
jgi:hypothetical protein